MNAPQPEPAPLPHPEAAPKPAARRGLLRRVTSGVVKLGIVAAVPALTLLAATRYLDIRPYWLDIPSNFQFHYLLAACLLLALAGGLRFRAGVILAFTLVLFQIPAFLPYYFGGAKDDGPANLRVGVANVYGANRHFDAFEAWIASEQPDAVLLQETEERWPAFLDLIMGEYGYAYVKSVEHPIWGFDARIFSRHPITAYETIELPHKAFPVQRAVIAVDGRKVALYNLHLFTSGQVREAQNDVLRAVLLEESLPHVLAGDFNATPWSLGQRQLLEGLDLRNAAFGFGYTPTWPARIKPMIQFARAILLREQNGLGRFSAPETITPFFARYVGIPLDHVYVSSGIGVVGASSGPGINSDHLPIVFDLRLP
jgi:endonuclease/exonuclease/phosphatase (EEP) superfamily protein YafD